MPYFKRMLDRSSQQRKCVASSLSWMTVAAPKMWSGPLCTRCVSSAMLCGCTLSWIVRFFAMVYGTPMLSVSMMGSGLMTLRPEKLTRFPIRLPRILPADTNTRGCRRGGG